MSRTCTLPEPTSTPGLADDVAHTLRQTLAFATVSTHNTLEKGRKYSLYHWFDAVHLPEAQVVGPVHPEPPHWP
jgi:hypothetical protein